MFYKRIFDFYISSSIHVALAVCAICKITLLEFDLPNDNTLLYFVMFATVVGYNFVKYFETLSGQFANVNIAFIVIGVFSVIALLLLLYYFFQLNFTTQCLVIALALITLMYALPQIRKNHNKRLREIRGLKVYIVALIWALVSVVLPLLNASTVSFNLDGLIVFLQRFIIVVVLMLPFEIRDLNFDALKLATIPQRLGIKNTKILGFVLVTIFFALLFLRLKYSHRWVIIYLVISVVILVFLWFSGKYQSKYYTSFWVESIPILWLLLYGL